MTWKFNRIFLEVASMVVTWWIVAFLRSESFPNGTHENEDDDRLYFFIAVQNTKAA